jgi:hypothetical protein
MKFIFHAIVIVCCFNPAYGQGVIFDDEEYNSSPIKAQLMRGDYQVPSSASIKKYSPRPGNQLDYSTSVAWAIAWQARTILFAKNNGLTDMDDIIKNIFAPAYIYQKAIEDENCAEGISLGAGLSAAKTYGMPLFNDYWNFCGGNDSPFIDSIAKKNVLTDFSKIFYLSDPPEKKILALKKTLSEGLPVVIGMATPPSFRLAKEFWQPKEVINGKYPGQALCVVGYDDAKYGGAFEVANSWGGSWGNKGYMWIRYKDFTDFTKYGYEIYVAEKERKYMLKGSIKLQRQDARAINVKAKEAGVFAANEAFASGAQFQVIITNEDPAFVYVIGSDLTGECFLLFPYDQTTSAALTYKSNHIAIPDETHFIEFDNTPGKDFLCVLYSKEELDIEGVIKKIGADRGAFYEKVKRVLGKQLINNSVTWAENEISFQGDTETGTIVAAIVEIEHH